MEHGLRISVSNRQAKKGIANIRYMSLRERILRFLLGDRRRLAIIVPGESVRELSIREIEEGEETDD